MEFITIGTERFGELKALHTAYKTEIGEEQPGEQDFESLKNAAEQGLIRFYGCVCDGKLTACCSVSTTYSTFNYDLSGVFEDFYILPEYRHRGIAGKLAAFAYKTSGVRSLCVGCADCDVEMYRHISFRIRLGNMLAYGD